VPGERDRAPQQRRERRDTLAEAERGPHQDRAADVAEADGSAPVNTAPTTMPRLAASRISSGTRGIARPRTGWSHSTISGATSRAPAASPSHHVSQTLPKREGSSSPPRTSAPTPIDALTLVATRPASVVKRSTRWGSPNAWTPPAKRLTSSAPSAASQVLPNAMPTDVPKVPAVVQLTTNAPMNTAGSTR
jgi:hypothetical protein